MQIVKEREMGKSVLLTDKGRKEMELKVERNSDVDSWKEVVLIYNSALHIMIQAMHKHTGRALLSWQKMVTSLRHMI